MEATRNPLVRSADQIKLTPESLLPKQQPEEGSTKQDEAWLENMRGWLMVVATLIVSLTYQAGLNPPGGVWQDNKDDPPEHIAGEPIGEYESPLDYYLFKFFNNMAFAQSVAIILVLMRRVVYKSKSTMQALQMLMGGNITALTLAYDYGYPSFRDKYYPISIPALVFFFLVLADVLVWLVGKLSGSKVLLIVRTKIITTVAGKVFASTFLFSLKAVMLGAIVTVQVFSYLFPDKSHLLDIPMNVLVLSGCLLWWYDIKRNC